MILQYVTYYRIKILKNIVLNQTVQTNIVGLAIPVGLKEVIDTFKWAMRWNKVLVEIMEED